MSIKPVFASVSDLAITREVAGDILWPVGSAVSQIGVGFCTNRNMMKES
jgi:hypothetical protein